MRIDQGSCSGFKFGRDDSEMNGRILPWPAVGCDLALDIQNGVDGHLTIQRAQPSDAPAGPWGRNE